MLAHTSGRSNAQDGDTLFESAWARTRRQAYRMAYRMTGNHDDAEDLTQEAYLRAYRSFDGFDRSAKFESWFFRILYHVILDHLQRRARRRLISLDEVSVGAALRDDRCDPEAIAVRNAVDEEILLELMRLPARFRDAVWMSDVKGMCYAQIGRAIGTRPTTVRTRILRGRRMLRRRLQDEMEG